MAGLYHKQRKLVEAESLLKQALDIYKKLQLLGNNYPDQAFSSCLNNLAMICHNQGKYAQAELFYLQALDIKKKLLGNNNLSLASSFYGLARLYHIQGKYKESEPLYINALKIYQLVLDVNNPIRMAARGNLKILQFQRTFTGTLLTILLKIILFPLNFLRFLVKKTLCSKDVMINSRQ